jgi:glycosyltransferase involved in cell wall biosynthesis
MQERHPQHHFVGVQRGQALAMHYASADVFLFPSLTETYGNVVAEAMASGLAVVAYRSAAASELIQDGVNGVTVSPGDRVAFVAAARRVAEDASLRRRLATQACVSVQSRSWDQVLRHFEAALNEVRAAQGE